MREPVSLVSAYDVARLGSPFSDLCREYRKSAVLLLDSGGYEHSHAQRYAGSRAPSWTFDDFKRVCELDIHDFAFSYDYFWRDDPYADESASDYELRLAGEFFSAHDFVAGQRLIPVLHLQTRDGEKRLPEAEILALVSRIGSECKSPFIAIPERELGDGLIERFDLAKKICDQLTRANEQVSLHLLGCGNPLTFAFMCVAGVRMADGLEWYRTFAAKNFHLHHFQQQPVFESASKGNYNPTAELIFSLDVPYRVKVATHNLMSFQTFTAGLASRLRGGSVHELVGKNFGKKVGQALQALEH